jgi:DNA invertase Pin-like site-specific DNA recombinase
MVAKGRSPRGDRSGHNAVTETQVREMHAAYATGESQARIAKRFGVSRGLVCDVMRGVNWKHLNLPAIDGRARIGAGKLHGEDQPKAKLTTAQVLEIRERAERGERHTSIARDYPVSRSGVYLIATRRNWKHI